MGKDYYLKRIAHDVVNILAGITEASWEMVEREQLTQVTEKALSILGMLEILEQRVFFKIYYEKFGVTGIAWGDPSEDIPEWYSACSDKYVTMNSMFDSDLLEDAVKNKFHAKFLSQNEAEQPVQDITVSHVYSSYRLSTSEKGLYHLGIIMGSLNHDTDELLLMLIKDWLTIKEEMPIINGDFIAAENDLDLYSYNHSTETEFNKNGVIRYRTDFGAIVLRNAQDEIMNSFREEDPILSRIFEQENDISHLRDKYNRFLGVTITGLVKGNNCLPKADDSSLITQNGQSGQTTEEQDNQQDSEKKTQPQSPEVCEPAKSLCPPLLDASASDSTNSLDTVTQKQVAGQAHLAIKSMTPYAKEWPKPLVAPNGRRAAQYIYDESFRAILASQFEDAEWPINSSDFRKK